MQCFKSFFKRGRYYLRLSLGVGLIGITSFNSCTQVLADEITQEASSRPGYVEFLKEFRCVTCPNQNIMDSSAPVAQAMKEEIARRWEQGESPETIRAFLLAQYGDYVLYRPALKGQTYLLWLGPFLMLCAGFAIWFKMSRTLRGTRP